MQQYFRTIVPVVILACASISGFADIKIKQRVTMGQQKIESTRMIKGSRERTEQKFEMADERAAAFMPQIANVTQCDERRYIRINDRKQLYYIEPFPTAEPAGAARPAAQRTTDPNTKTRRGGTLTMTFSIRDTGERRQMFGLTARHLIMTQIMEASADSCNGPSKTKMEFDGWYADFSAEFNCPIDLPPAVPQADGGRPDCIDKIVTRFSGGGKPGFLLEGTMKMFDAEGNVTMTHTTETLELSRSPLSAGLFDVPAGYKLASSQTELYAMPSVSDMMRDSMEDRDDDRAGRRDRTTPSAPAMRSVGVSINLGSGVRSGQEAIEDAVRDKLRERGLTAVFGGTGDYGLNIQVNKIKESTAGKIGGIFGKVTGVPTGPGKVDVELTVSLTSPGGGRPQTNRVSAKFDGPLSEAVRSALEEALGGMLDDLEN